MEPYGLLPCSQGPTTGPYPGSDICIHPTSLRSILSSFSLLSLGLLSGLFLSYFPTEIFYALLITPMLQSHPPWFIHSNNIWCSVQVMKLLSLCGLLQPPASFSLLGLNIVLSTLFSYSLTLSSRGLLCNVVVGYQIYPEYGEDLNLKHSRHENLKIHAQSVFFPQFSRSTQQIFVYMGGRVWTVSSVNVILGTVHCLRDTRRFGRWLYSRLCFNGLHQSQWHLWMFHV